LVLGDAERSKVNIRRVGVDVGVSGERLVEAEVVLRAAEREEIEFSYNRVASVVVVDWPGTM
jgi:hypothetical protein